ncbi:MAG: HAD family phosphatase [Lachnospira sp.]|nr:HAD family phosphatase [Lachnospira sp.]
MSSANVIKLVASDLDGTILLNGAQKVDETMIQAIDELVGKGIIFAPASGRQWVSLARLFQPVSDKLLLIGDNGAIVKYKGETLVKVPLDREFALKVIEDAYNMPNCEVLVSGEDTAYIKPKTEAYHYRMTKVVNYKTTLVENFADIKEDILKVAICDMTGIHNSQAHFFEKWSADAAVTVSGDLYLDVMDKRVSKGYAMKKVQQKLGIAPSECMAFGDNFNDCEMLDAVECSYVMETAVEEVKKHGKYITDNVENVIRRELL